MNNKMNVCTHAWMMVARFAEMYLCANTGAVVFHSQQGQYKKQLRGANDVIRHAASLQLVCD